MKTCSVCKQAKPLDEFHRMAKGAQGRCPDCKPCRLERVRSYREANRDKELARQRRYYSSNSRKEYDKWYQMARRYGLSRAEFEEMIDAQKGKCAICRRAEKLVVDHCHTSGRVRGLLCGGCNSAIGMMGDDPSRMRRAARYLST